MAHSGLVLVLMAQWNPTWYTDPLTHVGKDLTLVLTGAALLSDWQVDQSLLSGETVGFSLQLLSPEL